MMCRTCAGEIIGKGSQARVCKECQRKRHSKTSSNWAKRNPRTEYYQVYYLANKLEHNRKARERLNNENPEIHRARNRRWRNKHKLAIKIKRELGLKTMKEARALIIPRYNVKPIDGGV